MVFYSAKRDHKVPGNDNVVPMSADEFAFAYGERELAMAA